VACDNKDAALSASVAMCEITDGIGWMSGRGGTAAGGWAAVDSPFDDDDDVGSKTIDSSSL